MRRFVAILALLSLGACRRYDPYPYVSSSDGLVAADKWATYGPEQAMAIAIGRAFGQQGVDGAIAYSKKFDSVESIEADSLGLRLVVTFANGWHAQVNPIEDGKNGDETAGI